MIDLTGLRFGRLVVLEPGDTLLPKFEAASKAAQESIAQRGQELRGFRERVATAPGMPDSPELPEAPRAPKITANRGSGAGTGV